MRFGYKIFLTIFVLCMSFSIMSMKNDIIADDYGYGFNCGDSYEVSWINDSGKFDKVSCHASFSEAKNKMKELGGDHVVRHASSLSPTKIIAMNSGNAYTYPARSGRDTMKIFQDVATHDIYYKDTYVANHYELNYYDTERYLPNYNGGMIEVSLNGFHGFTDLEYTDLVPSKFIDKGLPIFLGGNDKTSENEQPFLVIVRRNYFAVEENNGYRELAFYYHRSYCKPSNTNKLDEEHRIVLGPAPDELKTGMKYYSANGYDFYTSPTFDNKAVTYYPYYQFLPLRTKTNLNADNLNKAFYTIKNASESALKDNGYLFIEAQEKYGVNALLLYAMAAHESGWGTSGYALERNNLFGWNAVDENPDDALYFKTLKDGIYEHAGINLRLYMDITDFRFFSSSLGNKGSGLNVKYASDPYWGMKIGAIAYQIDKVNSSNNNLNDYNRYELSLINEFDIKFHKDASKDSKVLYTSQYGPYYQENFIVVKLGEDGNMTKVQSTNPIRDGNVIVKDNTKKDRIEYDFNQSIAFVESKYLNALNHVQDDNTPKPEGDYVSSISDFKWNGNYLHIEGSAYVPGITINEENTITNTLVLYNSDKSKEYTLESTLNDDGSVTFVGDIDITLLEDGDYFFKVVTKYSKYSQYNNEFELRINSIPSSEIFDGHKYTFGMIKGKMCISKVEYTKVGRNVSSINEIKFDGSNVSIDGKAFKSLYNYNNPEVISHKLEIIDLETKQIIKTVELETYSTNGFSLNDGFNYDYVAYRGSFDLKELPIGSYTIRVNVTNGDMQESIIVMSTDTKYLLNYNVVEDNGYKMSINSLYNYRIEFDISKNVFDYNIINKESIRDSILSFESVSLEEGILKLQGVGYINRLDHAAANNPLYTLYLVDSNGNKYEINPKTVACQVDYGKFNKDKIDLSNACFDGEYDLTNIPNGTYELVVMMSTNKGDVTYYDIFNVTNRFKPTYEPMVYNGKVYEMVISNDRYKYNLVVTDE